MTTVIVGAGRKTRVLPRRGVTSPFFIGSDIMKELSIFVDESGDFGQYEPHSPYYIVTFIFHDQAINITRNIDSLNANVCRAGLPDYTIHAGPLIRRENEYRHLSFLERKRIFNFLYNFVRVTDISYHSIIVEKKHLVEDIDLNVQITKKLSSFLFEHLEKFIQYNRIIIYYDYCQMELTNILVSVFNTVLQNVEFKKISPTDYKLFQAADLFCTMELLNLKIINKTLSNSELAFFSSEKNLYKAYLRSIHKKRFSAIGISKKHTNYSLISEEKATWSTATSENTLSKDGVLPDEDIAWKDL